MAANMSWYTQNTIEGTRELPMEGWSSTPLKPKYSINRMLEIEVYMGMETTYSDHQCICYRFH